MTKPLIIVTSIAVAALALVFVKLNQKTYNSSLAQADTDSHLTSPAIDPEQHHQQQQHNFATTAPPPQTMAATSAFRSITKIVRSVQKREGGGFLVREPLGGRELSSVDPFLLLHHLGPVTYGPGQAVGAPDHPHRGMETLTYILQGELGHKDSMGTTGNLTPGCAQYMTAGSGVIHSEMPSEKIFKEGGTIEGFQLWINLAADKKMTRPRYQDTPSKDLPEVTTADGLTTVKVVVGTALGATSIIEPSLPMVFYDVRLKPGGAFDADVPAGLEGFVYVYKGSGGLVGSLGQGKTATLSLGQLGVLSNDGDKVSLKVDASHNESCSAVVIAGRPLREPIARYGPFVMSTHDQLVQAFEDFEAGRFGKIDGAEERYRQTEEARQNAKKSGRTDL